jgi:multidrug transporter EmrE-like cation transporter
VSLPGLFVVILTALLVVVGNVMLRAGLKLSGVVPFSRGVTGLPMDVIQLLLQPVFLVAVVLYGFSMLLWLRVVATEPLSIAYPVLAAVTFVTLSVVSVVFLHEPMSIRKAVGLTAILVGLILVARTN